MKWLCENCKDLRGIKPRLIPAFVGWVWMKTGYTLSGSTTMLAAFRRSQTHGIHTAIFTLKRCKDLVLQPRLTAHAFKQDWNTRVAYIEWINAMPEALFEQIPSAYLWGAFCNWWPCKRLAKVGAADDKIQSRVLIPYRVATQLTRRSRKNARRELAGISQESIQRDWEARCIAAATPKATAPARVGRL